ncbi:DNA polymerase, partial [Streptococcus agalactiae]|uniref:DNA polymerase n=1 Tax=Streptococcus agalactiae TaxID=1311 RepID=UPI00178C514A
MLSYNIGTVYVHNLSKFDSYFINKILLSSKDLDVEYKFNKHTSILSIIVRYKDKRNKFKIIFRDSLLLVQGSLKSLSM